MEKGCVDVFFIYLMPALALWVCKWVVILCLAVDLSD